MLGLKAACYSNLLPYVDENYPPVAVTSCACFGAQAPPAGVRRMQDVNRLLWAFASLRYSLRGSVIDAVLEPLVKDMQAWGPAGGCSRRLLEWG